MQSLAYRLLALGAVFGVEAIFAFPRASLINSTILFGTLFIAFCWVRHRAAVASLFAPYADTPIGWRMAGAHFAAFALLLAVSRALVNSHLTGSPLNWLERLNAAAGLGMYALGIPALIPYRFIRDLIRATGRLVWYAALGALATIPLVWYLPRMWESTAIPLSQGTLWLSASMLRLVLPGIMVDPARVLLGTERFTICIDKGCSGIEGLALMLGFGVVWFGLFHKELRFPRALLLIPLGVVLLFLLNAARIAALVLIGNAGAPEIAVGGFHSEAGWVAFNSVAMGMAVLAQRSGWFAAPGFQPVESARPSNPTAAFLVPFLAILAAGMLAQATSGGFEWAYPMRIVAALVALAVLRRGYAGVDWSISWAGPVAGIVVFALWIVADRGSSPMPAALAAAPGGVRNFWIAIRVFGACVTVPVAEELAFRGYAMRRLVAVDFETVPLSGVTWVAVVVSSILFGAIHGPRWPAGIAAGLIFAYAARRRGKLGDAVAAHAVANGLLACFVLYRGAWQYW